MQGKRPAVTSRSHPTPHLPLLAHLFQFLKPLAREARKSLEPEGRELLDKRYRKLQAFRHLCALVFLHFAHLRSLRQLESGLRNDPAWRKVRPEYTVSKSCLAEVNAKRDPRFFEAVLHGCTRRGRSFFPSALPARFGRVWAVDGCVFGCPKSMTWAKYQTNHRALKLHLAFDLSQRVPRALELTPAKTSEREVFVHFVEPGVTYVKDRGYPKRKNLNFVHALEAFFVVRVSLSTKFRRVRSRPITGRSKERLLRDVDVRYGKYGSGDDREDPIYRLVSFKDDYGEVLHVLTNRKDLSTADIALLYRRRWNVELFFRWAKAGKENKQERIHWFGRSFNAVSIQILTCLITYVLELSLTADLHSSVEIPRHLGDLLHVSLAESFSWVRRRLRAEAARIGCSTPLPLAAGVNRT